MKTNNIYSLQILLLRIFIFLTILFIAGQVSFFFIHHIVTGLYHSLVHSPLSIKLEHPTLLLPLLLYIFLQLFLYAIFIAWIWFISISFGEIFKLNLIRTYWFGIVFWFLGCFEILSLNAHYYPDSYYAGVINQISSLENLNSYIAFILAGTLIALTLIAYFNFLFYKRHRIVGSLLLLLALIAGPLPLSTQFFSSTFINSRHQPNIILIGLDSLRPDFVDYLNNQNIHTPNINYFLQSASTFTDAYTPLARTFPAWVSILTAKYPKHNGARNNLMDPKPILINQTLARRLQQAGYETIYATDENRFSNITAEYGFDRIIGPNMGATEFLLAGLGDFPLSNLITNLPIGKFLFPYNYANRAAAVTYRPDSFIQLLQNKLYQRSHKPLFLVVHLCLSHWPFIWAHDINDDHFNLLERYQHSVEAVDQQLGELLQVLKAKGLLENSIVVLLSDHGTTLGIRGDRITAKSKYIGNLKNINILERTRLSTAPQFSVNFKNDFGLSAIYGHGTDILGLKQNHVLLAIKGFGISIPSHKIDNRCLLIDIAPTVLDILHLPPLKHIDGVSLTPYVYQTSDKKILPRTIFFETADKLAGIETDKIDIPKVVKERINSYRINLKNGLLYLKTPRSTTFMHTKQHAVLRGEWLLVSYPVPPHMLRSTIKKSSYFILINLKLGQWTIGLSSSLAKKAPIKELLLELKKFYGDEI